MEKDGFDFERINEQGHEYSICDLEPGDTIKDNLGLPILRYVSNKHTQLIPSRILNKVISGEITASDYIDTIKLRYRIHHAFQTGETFPEGTIIEHSPLEEE